MGWPNVSLAEITSKIGSGSTPRGGSEAYLDSRTNFALIRSQNVYDRKFDQDGLAYISDEQAEALKGAVVQAADILLNITGDGVTFGRACLVPNDVLPACVNQHVSIIRIDPVKADAEYVLSFLTHPDVKAYIESFNAGGSRRAITKGHIESFRLPLPPLRTQRAIGRTLRSFDDKIELNRRTNETLDAIVCTLFKSWFINFDPVRGKAAGRTPVGSASQWEEFFPSEFSESELGPIPSGWNVGRLDDLIVLQRGFDLPAQSREHGPYAVVAASGPTEGHAESRARGPGVITGRSGVLGRVFLVLEDFWPLNTTLWVKEFRACGPYYAYLALRQIDFSLFNAGSAVPTLNRNHIHGLPWIIPPRALVDAFERFAEPIFRYRDLLEKQSQTAAQIRDTLLPRLLSGRLSVDEAERSTGHVT